MLEGGGLLGHGSRHLGCMCRRSSDSSSYWVHGDGRGVGHTRYMQAIIGHGANGHDAVHCALCGPLATG